MFKFSSKTEVNKQIKITDLFKTIKADKQTRAASQNVQSVTLTHVLSEATTGLKSAENITEIYFIDMVTTDKRVPIELIKAMDKTILFQVFYTIKCGSDQKFIATYKTIEAGKATFTKHYESDWVKESAKLDFPLVTELGDIFMIALQNITSRKFQSGESIRDYLSRLAVIDRLTRDIEKTERMMNSATQPKDKLALHAELKKLKQAKEEVIL